MCSCGICCLYKKLIIVWSVARFSSTYTIFEMQCKRMTPVVFVPRLVCVILWSNILYSYSVGHTHHLSANDCRTWNLERYEFRKKNWRTVYDIATSFRFPSTCWYEICIKKKNVARISNMCLEYIRVLYLPSTNHTFLKCSYTHTHIIYM